MIAMWLVLTTLFGLFVAVAALLLERACAALGAPRRWAWLGAMVVCLGTPFLPSRSVTAHSANVTAAAWATPRPTSLEAQTTMARAASSAMTIAVEALTPLDWPLLALWLAASASLIVVAGRSARQLTRMQRGWVRTQREGMITPSVWVSDDIGPGAFGVSRADVVIPRWAMALSPLDRRLLLLHERSHAAAHDPRLLACARAMLMLAPWHAPLRWCFSQLVRAIEQDCDRRVLNGTGNTRRYADLLLKVAERGVNTTPWSGGVMASLLSSRRDLEARLRSLSPAAVTIRSRLQALVSTAVAAALVFAACLLPMPQRIAAAANAALRAPVISAQGSLHRDPAWTVSRRRSQDPWAREQDHSDSVYFARTDSLVISAIEYSRPALLRLASTEAPYVAIIVSRQNEVVAHSVGAGAPVGRAAHATKESVRRELAAASAGFPNSAQLDAHFAARMARLVNRESERFGEIGISHLLVGSNPFTVLWVRIQSNGD